MKTVMNSRTLRALSTRARIAGVIVAVAFAGLFMAACKESGPLTVASVTISPTSPQTITVGSTLQFTAVVRDNEGNVLSNTPTWAIVSRVGTISTITQTGLFTAGPTPGTTIISVTCRGISVNVTITVTAGAALTITVEPDTTLVVGATAQFRAVVRDAFGNIVTATLAWSATSPPGTINATGFFTAGNTLGTFPNSVQACIGTTTTCAQADVTVILPPAPPAVSGFTVLAFAAVTCTDGSIIGEVGTDRALGDVPPGSISQSICPISSGTAQVGTPAAKTAFSNFVTTYNSLATVPCGVVLTGTLDGFNLPPGVYCFDAGASPTGTLTLTGTSTDRWLFKIGTTGTGGLTPGLFTVVMAGGALPCNVTWWVQQAASITDSDFNGSVLAGAGITLTRGSFHGNAWAGASATGGDVTITGPLATAVTGCP